MTTTVRRRKPRFAAGGSYGSPSTGGGAIPESTLNPAWSNTGTYTPGTMSKPNNSFAANPSAPQGIDATAQGLPSATPSTGQFSAGPQSSTAGSWGNAADTGIAGNPGYGAPTGSPATYTRPNTAGNYGAYHVKTSAPTALPTAPNNTVGWGGWLVHGGGYAKGGPVKEFRRGGRMSHMGGVNTGNTSDYRPLAQQQSDFDQADTVGQINRYFSQQKPIQDAIKDYGQGADSQHTAAPQSQAQPRQQRQPQPQQPSRTAQQAATDNSLMKQLMGRQQQPADPGSPFATAPSDGSSDSSSPAAAPDVVNPGTGQSAGGDAAAAAGAEAGAAAGGLAKGGPVKLDNVKEKPYRQKWRAKNGKKATPYRAFDEGGSVSPEYNDGVGSGMGFAEGGAIPESEDDLDTSDDKQGDVNPLLGVQKALTYTRQKFGLDDAIFQQMAGMPTKPAGSGGDKPNPNPFPTKTTNPPFGQRSSNDDNDGDEGDSAVVAKKGGAIPEKYGSGGAVGPEDVESEDLPYKKGTWQPGENLKGEANPQDPSLGAGWED